MHRASKFERFLRAVVANPVEAALFIPESISARHDYPASYEPVASRVLPNPRLDALGYWLDASEGAQAGRPRDVLEAAIAANKRDFGARFELAQAHFAAGQFTQALDELLEILMRDKAWNDGLARKVYVGILELMAKPPAKSGAEAAVDKPKLEITGHAAAGPSDPVLDQYRRRLSMTVLS